MADPSFIETFYDRHSALYQHLISAGEITFAADLNITFAKSLVLAIASYFENEVTELMREIPERYAAANPIITSMIEKQAISRKYHTYFDWDELKAGTFFGLFGGDFKSLVQSKIKSESAEKEAMEAFLQLGQTRNRLVHQNFIQFEVEKTPDELIAQFRIALRFPAFVRENLFPSSEAEPISRKEAPGELPAATEPSWLLRRLRNILEGFN